MRIFCQPENHLFWFGKPPEAALRERRWCPIGETIPVLDNEELKKLMVEAVQRLADRYRPDGVNPIEELQR